MAESFIPESLREAEDEHRRARLTLALCCASVVASFAYSLASLADGAIVPGAVGLAMGTLGLAAGWLLRATASLRVLSHYAAGLWFVALSAAVYAPEGFGTPALVATAVVPMVALLIGGMRDGLFWVGATCASVLVFATLDVSGVELPNRYLAESRRAIDYATPIFFILIIFAMSAAYEAVKNAALRSQSRSDDARRKAEDRETLARAEAKLLETNHMASVGQLAAGVAHEVNNPLAYVLANLDHVDDALGDADQDLKQAIDEARKGARHVARIVADLGSFVQTERQSATPVSLREVVEQSMKMVDHQIRHVAHVGVEVDGAPRVVADRTRLVQVLVNLLVNAKDAVAGRRPGDASIQIEVGPAEGGMVRIAVRDTGVGIDGATIARLTEPFFTTKPVGQGTGLGLAVCNNIVRGYGGELKIESTVGKGTEVSVFLPAAERPPVVQEEQVMNEVEPSRQLLNASGVVRKKLRVLIIDDDALVRRSLARTLRRHDVATVDTGAEALELLGRSDSSSFDVIVCDVMMPEISGIELYERIRRDWPALSRRILFLTGGAFTPFAREFLETTDNPVVRKPASADHLRSILARFAQELASELPDEIEEHEGATG